MHKLLNANLRTKLLVLIFITTIIPILLLGLVIYQYISGLLQEQFSENELNHLSTVHNQFEYLFQEIEQASLFFSQNDEIQAILQEDTNDSSQQHFEKTQHIQQLFDTVIGVKDWEVNLYIIGKNEQRYFSNEYLPNNYNQINENWGVFRKAHEANGQMVWDTNYMINPTLRNHDVILTSGRAIYDEGDELIGYVMIDINENALSSIYESNNHVRPESFYLLDNQGYTISSFPEKSSIGLNFDTDFTQRIISGQSGYFTEEWQEDESVVTHYSGSETPFHLLTIKPISVINQENQLIRRITFNFALIGFIIAAWLAYLLSRQMTTPLYELIHLMKEVEKGNLDVRFNRKYNDDIGRFGARFNAMLGRLKNLIQESYEKQVLIKESELKALRAQTNPHFLYNTLDTVNWLARMKGANEISKIVVSLSKIMKYTIRKGEELVTVREDLKHLNYYISIQEYRFTDQFVIDLETEEVMDYFIPPLILQPLVENAIVHGLENKMEKGHIFIELKKVDDFIEVTVRDDGVGMDEETLNKLRKQTTNITSKRGTGIGLENVKNRLSLHYGADYGWKVKSEIGKGTVIKVLIPKEVG